ncbi:hypothetical protein SSIN_0571 [Streptococcus sinensis]|uniref:Uncharacterized protein n=1 Tax=Streptococcus sinensis TaxID=176090 RepID=A0A0A0DHV2_9STRE|nr:hypothetical protein SSIN_0571 [Streptococcus sinensis]
MGYGHIVYNFSWQLQSKKSQSQANFPRGNDEISSFNYFAA